MNNPKYVIDEFTVFTLYMLIQSRPHSILLTQNCIRIGLVVRTAKYIYNKIDK